MIILTESYVIKGKVHIFVVRLYDSTECLHLNRTECVYKSIYSLHRLVKTVYFLISVRDMHAPERARCGGVPYFGSQELQNQERLQNSPGAPRVSGFLISLYAAI